ncbi:MAG: hypothetical protein ACRDTF_16075 [Pseudonocardiaceae bacterium]
MRVRWLYSTADERAHVLDEDGDAGSGRVVTRCWQVLADTTPVYQIAPSMNVCPRCGLYAAVPPPEHPTRPESMPPESRPLPRNEDHHDAGGMILLKEGQHGETHQE